MEGHVMQDVDSARWTDERAWAWYRGYPWLVGFNYVPSTAINTTEMWQRDTFDPTTIDRELGWGARIGFNSCRVFLQYLVWSDDSAGAVDRIDHFLDIADRHNISTILCPFDDCAFSGKQPSLGPQAAPRKGIHNSGWTPSPGHGRVTDRAAWPDLRAFIAAIVSRFGRDRRVLLWDLYNEPGNAGMGEASLPLLQETFRWARDTNPAQPLTAGLWSRDLPNLNAAMRGASDVITFHDYFDLSSVEQNIAALRAVGRPIVCTEWMRRNHGSLFSTHLPVFAREGVGCYFWSLVNGRTQTHLPWGSPEGAGEPPVWYHDLLRPDGTFHLEEERATIAASTAARPQRDNGGA